MTRNLLKNISDKIIRIRTKGQGMYILAFLLAFSGCSGEQKYREDTTETLKTDKQQIETDTVVISREKAMPVEEVEIRALGNSPADMAFDRHEIQVKAGTMVKLTLHNDASDLTMMHNIVFTTKGEGRVVAIAGAKAGAPGRYVPDTVLVVAASPISKPGQTISFEFKAPSPGEYDYICTYNDHYKYMNGKLIVK